MTNEIDTCRKCATLKEKLDEVEGMLFAVYLFNEIRVRPLGYTEWIKEYRANNKYNLTEWRKEND